MVLNVVFFLIVSSGSIFGVSILKKKYVEMLPISVLTIILIQFLFGLAGRLKIGAYFVYFSAAVLYAISFIFVIRTKSYKEVFSRLLTPDFAIILTLYIVINFANSQKLASSWDEFSHWADVVKAMVSIDDLAANPMSMSAFKSYVPAMPLFQYNFQVLGQLLHKGFFFSEWRLYVAYQFATYALLSYFLKDLTWEKVGTVIVYGIVMFFLPSVFFDFYNTLYIDAFLGVIAGCSFAYVIFIKHNHSLDDALVFLSLTCLVLTKDVGFVIALFIGLLYLIKKILDYKKYRLIIKVLLQSCYLAVSVFLPKLLWSFYINSHEVSISFSNSVDLNQLIHIFFRGDRSDYRWVTFQKYWRALSENRIYMGDTSIGVGYLLLLLVLLSGIFVLLSSNKQLTDSKWIKYIKACILVFCLVYVVGMCVVYMFKFSENEATTLASLSRYLSTLFMMLYTIYCFLLAKSAENKGRYWLAALAVFILMIPTLPAQKFVSGENVRTSKTVRAPYTDVSLRAKRTLGDRESKVYIISQEDMGLDFWVLRYSLRPSITNENFTWSIGHPFYEGDIWTVRKTADEWLEELVDEYDFVLLYRVNEYFIQEFSKCFEDSSSIKPGILFEVDKDKKILFETSKAMFKGQNTLDDELYSFDLSGKKGSEASTKNNWVLENGIWYFYKEDVKKTGWLQQGEIWYYLLDNGAMATGTHTINGQISIFDSNGAWIGYD